MTKLVAVMVIFLLSHLLPMLPPWRRRLVGVLGNALFLTLYSLLSLAILYWLARTYVTAPIIVLWPWQSWATWIPVAVMPFASILLVAALTSRNPFSLGLGGEGYRPDSPGIVSITRHPAMWAFILWAAAHIPPNGDLASLLLFGFLLLLAIVGTGTMERARARRHDPAEWSRWRRGTANLPFAGEMAIDWRGIGVWRPLLGVILYLALLFAHQTVIGVAPPPLRGY